MKAIKLNKNITCWEKIDDRIDGRLRISVAGDIWISIGDSVELRVKDSVTLSLWQYLNEIV